MTLCVNALEMAAMTNALVHAMINHVHLPVVVELCYLDKVKQISAFCTNLLTLAALFSSESDDESD